MFSADRNDCQEDILRIKWGGERIEMNLWMVCRERSRWGVWGLKNSDQLLYEYATHILRYKYFTIIYI